MSESIVAGRILFVGAHCDDIEIGCGGTAAKFHSKGHLIAFATATRVSDEKMAETRKIEATRAAALLGLSEDKRSLFFGSLMDGELGQRNKELRVWLKSVAAEFKPDTIFIHREDEHTDHQAVCSVAKGVFENKNVFLYAIPRPAPDIPFSPTCGIAISDFIERKVAMCECHASQRPIYISRDSVLTVAHNCYLRWYGATQMRADGYAEEFLLRSWRTPIGASEAPELPSIPDDLRLIQSADGTLRWAD